MSHRVSPSVAGLLALTFVPLAAGCSNDPARSTCAVEYTNVNVARPSGASSVPLTLLPDARLDAVGDGFVLLGTDGSSVRWALLGRDGVATGDEQSLAVPPHAAGPWFAVAGLNTPGDHIVIAYVPVDPPGAPAFGTRELMTMSARIDNTAPTAPSSSGPIGFGAEVTMRSGRAGMHAGVAWAQHGQTTISARLLGGDGLPVEADLTLGPVSDSIPGCLRFSSGKGDLTVGFIDTSTVGAPLFVGTEIAEDGSANNSLRLKIGKELPDCVDLVSSDKGYGVAWHSAGVGTGGVGTYFGMYEPARPGFPSAQVQSDVRVEGAVPAVAGLGWLGTQYALVFARPTSAEVWPIDAMGARKGVLPVLPSVAGHLGTVSSLAIGSVLYTTYADYLRDKDFSGGSRLLVKVTCP